MPQPLYPSRHKQPCCLKGIFAPQPPARAPGGMQRVSESRSATRRALPAALTSSLGSERGSGHANGPYVRGGKLTHIRGRRAGPKPLAPGDLPGGTGMTPSSAPTPSGGRSPSLGVGSAALGLENRRKKKNKTKTLSPVIPFCEATGRGGKCTAHYSKRAGGQGASWQAEPRVFAGSLPPDTEAPLVAITAVWILPEFISQLIKGAAFLFFFFFPFHFFFFFSFSPALR